MSKSAAAEERVKVTVRKRPANKKETDEGSHDVVTVYPATGDIELTPPADKEGKQKRKFAYDYVYGEGSRQMDIYKECAMPIVDSVMSGFNGTVFAYGQTSSGKTFTMTGLDPKDMEARGIIPTSFDHIFTHIRDHDDKQYVVQVTFVEIYCEAVCDLLSQWPEEPLQLHDSPELGVTLVNPKRKDPSNPKDRGRPVAKFVVKNPQEMMAKLQDGNNQRHVGATAMNKDSSRSHSIFTIIVESMSQEGTVLRGKLNLVDLAGSERQSKTKSEGARFHEATKINLSLMNLGIVIKMLVRGQKAPFRASKLTHLLCDSLGGNTKTLMIACISPASSNFEETLSTLRYAWEAKQIKNKPVRNEDPKDALLRQMQEEIMRLKGELQGGQSAGSGIADIAGAVGVDPALLMKLKNEKEEAVKAALEKVGMAENVRQQVWTQFQKTKAEEEEEAKRKDGLQQELKQMESRIIMGGVNLLDENEELEKTLALLDEQRTQQEEEQKEMERQIKGQKEEALMEEEHYKSLEDEVTKKKVKMERVWERIKLMQQELLDLQDDFEREREEMCQHISDLNQELQLKEIVVDYFVPEEHREQIEQCSRFIEDEQAWSIRSLTVAGNNRPPPEVVLPITASSHSSMEWRTSTRLSGVFFSYEERVAEDPTPLDSLGLHFDSSALGPRFETPRTPSPISAVPDRLTRGRSASQPAIELGNSPPRSFPQRTGSLVGSNPRRGVRLPFGLS